MPWAIDPDTGDERFFEEGHPDVERIEALKASKHKMPWALLAVALGIVLFLNRRKHA